MLVLVVAGTSIPVVEVHAHDNAGIGHSHPHHEVIHHHAHDPAVNPQTDSADETEAAHAHATCGVAPGLISAVTSDVAIPEYGPAPIPPPASRPPDKPTPPLYRPPIA